MTGTKDGIPGQAKIGQEIFGIQSGGHRHSHFECVIKAFDMLNGKNAKDHGETDRVGLAVFTIATPDSTCRRAANESSAAAQYPTGGQESSPPHHPQKLLPADPEAAGCQIAGPLNLPNCRPPQSLRTC